MGVELDGDWYRGRARGGPLDGLDVCFEGDPGIVMRGFVFNVLVNDDMTWATYGFAQRAEPSPGDDGIGIFDYLGEVARPGYPPEWWEKDQARR